MSAIIKKKSYHLFSRLRLRGGVVGLLCVIGYGCKDATVVLEPLPRDWQSQEAKAIAIQFSDRAEEYGLRFTPVNGQSRGHLSILESLGTGVGVIDFDADGDLDVFFPGGGDFAIDPLRPVGVACELFRNDGKGHFVPVGNQAAVNPCDFFSHGANSGDFNSDGFSDVLVTGYNGLALLHNMGDGTFRHVDPKVHGLLENGWSTSAAWGDFNTDGMLDLYVVRYVDWSFDNHPPCLLQGNRDICPPGEFEPLDDSMYLSNGAGRFIESSERLGLRGGGKGLGVVVTDLDLDGDTDIYVANDTTANFLYRNLTNESFEECGLIAGVAFGEDGESEGSMGTDAGDFNLDGMPDLWVSNFENQSFALYQNVRDCHFEHVSSVLGVTAVGAVYVGFGTMFVDVDLDGVEDLFATNGHVMLHPRDSALLQCPLLFHNRAGRRMVNVANSAGAYFTTGHMGRGAAVGDFDGDADADVIVSHTNEPVALLINETQAQSQPLSIRLIGISSNRDAIGATAILTTTRRTLLRQVKGGGSYLSTSTRELVWGLLSDEEPMSLSLHWPGGKRIELPWNLKSGRVTIRETSQGEALDIVDVPKCY
ncbi:MAG: CRTAC1 family protein [Planctomycetaceae bacterium]|nr:MAG: CRTAC1 family protein [Planctomycetaceae bacterium]